ncbi:hypothetical protein V8E55_008916 [Tylopilus felleus]
MRLGRRSSMHWNAKVALRGGQKSQTSVCSFLPHSISTHWQQQQHNDDDDIVLALAHCDPWWILHAPNDVISSTHVKSRTTDQIEVIVEEARLTALTLARGSQGLHATSSLAITEMDIYADILNKWRTSGEQAYFFAADVVIAIVRSPEERATASAPALESPDGEWERRVMPSEVEVDLERARAGRTWDECLVGTMLLHVVLVKPNCPGRSSRICNVGFVVPPSHRNSGYGRVLAQLYLYYAPRLGYEASMFNLVYVNNVASVW